MSQGAVALRGIVHRAQPSSRVRGFMAAALSGLVLGLGVPVSAAAESGADTALKNVAIAGTVASWTAALFGHAPVGACLFNGNSNGSGAEWGLHAQAGRDDELKFASLGAVRRECHLMQVGSFALDVAPVISVSGWSAESQSAGAHRAWDVAYVPMLHWRMPIAARTRLDFEFGIGPMYLSRAHVGDRQKGSNFQFSDHFGVGIGSADGHWRVGLIYRHVSNLDIREPNNAVDFKGISLEWRP